MFLRKTGILPVESEQNQAKRNHFKKECGRNPLTSAMRGSERRVIFIRDTKSRIFEEAYFILRRGVGDSVQSISPDDMVREAQRIVDENAHYSARRTRLSPRVRSFLAGAASAGALMAGCALLFAVL